MLIVMSWDRMKILFNVIEIVNIVVMHIRNKLYVVLVLSINSVSSCLLCIPHNTQIIP